MQEQLAGEQKEEEDPYVTFFINESNSGFMFDEDLSILVELPPKSLTSVEKTARRDWQKVRNRIESHYLPKKSPKISDTNELLQERLVAPSLAVKNASTRSTPAEALADRRTPAEMFSWRDFGQGLAAFVQPNKQLSGNPVSTFTLSLLNGRSSMATRDERQEEIFLVGLLNSSLREHGLTGSITSSGPTVGKPDIMTTSVGGDDNNDDDTEEEERIEKRDVKVLAEFKSTHNLALPMSAASVCALYNTAYQAVYIQRCGRTQGWVRVCHPLGQLLGYMADNSRRYGVLSSGTRSYFVRIRKRGDNEEAVEISDAMFIGEENYLKAWCISITWRAVALNPWRTKGLDGRKRRRKH